MWCTRDNGLIVRFVDDDEPAPAFQNVEIDYHVESHIWPGSYDRAWRCHLPRKIVDYPITLTFQHEGRGELPVVIKISGIPETTMYRVVMDDRETDCPPRSVFWDGVPMVGITDNKIRVHPAYCSALPRVMKYEIDPKFGLTWSLVVTQEDDDEEDEEHDDAAV